MIKETAFSDIINMNLRQMGATEIRSITGRIHRVTFDLGEGKTVTYLYQVTTKGEFFLQRREPYAVTKGIFANEQEVLEYIEEDVLMFRNIIKGNNYDKFLAIGQKLTKMVDSLEDMVFYCDVDEFFMDDIIGRLNSVDQEIQHITEVSPKLPEMIGK